MKKSKRLIIAALALIMMLSMTINVSASSVPSKQGRYVVEELSERYITMIPIYFSTFIPSIDPNTPSEDFIDMLTDNNVPGSEEIIPLITGRKFLTPFFEATEEPVGSLTAENVDILVYVPGISKYSSDKITIICYNVVTKRLEKLSFTFEGTDTIKVHFNNLSPLAIVVDEKGDIEDVSKDIKVITKSPKTGASTKWEYFGLAALALGVCGFAVVRKRQA